MNTSLSQAFGGNPWVKAWLNAPDEKAARSIVRAAYDSRLKLGEMLSVTPIQQVKDEQLRQLREFEVATVLLHAPDPNSPRVERKLSHALAGRGYPGGYLPSEQLRLWREEAIGESGASATEPVRITARGLNLQMTSPS